MEQQPSSKRHSQIVTRSKTTTKRAKPTTTVVLLPPQTRGWELMSPDVAQYILHFLGEDPWLIGKFRAVCRRWRLLIQARCLSMVWVSPLKYYQTPNSLLTTTLTAQLRGPGQMAPNLRRLCLHQLAIVPRYLSAYCLLSPSRRSPLLTFPLPHPLPPPAHWWNVFHPPWTR